MLCYRSHTNLHLHACQNRAMECKVPGCKRMMLRRDYGSHILDAAQSHHTLQDAEIQRLRRVINDKVTLPSIALLAVSPNLFYLAINDKVTLPSIALLAVSPNLFYLAIRRRMNSIPQSFAFSTILSKSEVTSSVS